MTETTSARVMPKGGRTGGAVFPRANLEQATTYARKLVVKTHTAAQPADVIFSGVVGAKSGIGQVRMSALKQYGYLVGDNKKGFSASEFAKRVAAAPADELTALYRQAALRPKVFKAIFDTFVGDKVSRAKLKQRAAGLDVHLDQSDACVETYVSSLLLAGLVSVDGDQVQHLSHEALRPVTPPIAGDEVLSSDIDEPEAGGEAEEQTPASEAQLETPSPVPDQIPGNARPSGEQHQAATPRAIFNVNVTLDSSLDTEKLAKQLEILKRYGAI